MNTVVLYESQYGNTQRLAELIGKELAARGAVRVMSIAECELPLPADLDLLVVGAPTQAHGMTLAMKTFVERLQPKRAGVPVAVFDTRVKGPMLLWGSAARAMVAPLTASGFQLIDEPEHFTVSFSRPPQLGSGEEEHATAWAGRIADRMPAGLVTAG